MRALPLRLEFALAHWGGVYPLKHRILLVDDHEVVRKGIAALLNTRWEVCGEARDGAEALEQVRQLKPELVILDLRMPGMSGTIAAKAIRRAVPDMRMMLLSVHDSETGGIGENRRSARIRQQASPRQQISERLLLRFWTGK